MGNSIITYLFIVNNNLMNYVIRSGVYMDPFCMFPCQLGKKKCFNCCSKVFISDTFDDEILCQITQWF